MLVWPVLPEFAAVQTQDKAAPEGLIYSPSKVSEIIGHPRVNAVDTFAKPWRDRSGDRTFQSNKILAIECLLSHTTTPKIFDGTAASCSTASPASQKQPQH